jgi:hypothetical protein
MVEHPYKNLPTENYWKRSVVEPAFDLVDPVVHGKFRISPSDRVATAGSCFAQHIARHLKVSGFNYYVWEQSNPVIPDDLAIQYGFGLFPARYGNIYTSRQLIQLLKRAYGYFQPIEDMWIQDDGQILDPFRPQIQPRGYSSADEYAADRRQHFAAIRRMVEELDIFIFTLGLTEGWVSKEDGAAYPLCPGVVGGTFDDSRHGFVNLRINEVVDDLREAVSFIRDRNPRARFILTVSPVPLVATAEMRSVIVSTTYSKSVLRVAAEEIANADAGIAYFPSFEIITGIHTRGRYFDNDLRSVTEDGVRRVMELFMRHYTDLTQPPRRAQEFRPAVEKQAEQLIAEAIAVMCDEEALDR